MSSMAGVANAFSVLGLSEGSSLETVKMAYKQRALRTHPDKNPDNPEATVEFQRVTAAYSVLLQHLDQSSKTSSGFRTQPGFPGNSFYGYDNSDDGYDNDDYGAYYDDASDSDDDILFYLWLFQQMMGGGSQYRRSDHRTRRHQGKDESLAQHQERVRRSREEQLTAQQRRKRETAARKARAAREKEQEQREAEQRQKDKLEAKKAQADAARKSAEDKAREIQRQAQEARSVVFAAARQGALDTVVKGVWENGVDAAGGEIKPNCSAFVQTAPEDLSETLLHIATSRGNLDMVKWLDKHSAEPDERNSQNLTPFQMALKTGQVHIAKYFLEIYPPKISEYSIYDCSGCSNLMSLALESRDPELVWLILDHKLATSQEVHEAWVWASSAKGQQILQGEHPTPSTIEKAEDIVTLLERYDDNKTPVAPTVTPTPSDTKKLSKEPISSNKPQSSPTIPSYINQSHLGRGNGRARGRGRGRGRGSSYSPSH